MFKVSKVVANIVLFLSLAFVICTSFLAGYSKGFMSGRSFGQSEYKNFVEQNTFLTSTPAPSSKKISPPNPETYNWGGPELWEAVNKRRVELGVNPLTSKSEVCTIASIRLNQILEIGKLDGHQGFSRLPDERPDLTYIFEKYDLTEFLVSGASSASEAVSLWEHTLGHKELVSGGQYVWGCIYAQEGYGVAITAY